MSSFRRIRLFPAMGSLIILLAVSLAAGGLLAQDDGQFCVRAYEDRNGNNQRDAGEALLQHGISVTLHDASGVIIQSALLETSPTVAQGLVCFQGLAAGQYLVTVSSAELLPTGLDNMTATILPGALPTIFEYGGHRIIAAPDTAVPVEEDNTEALKRLVVAAGGGVLTMVIVAFLGIVIYLLILRKPARRTHAGPAHTDPYERYQRPTDSRSTQQHPQDHP